MLYEVAITKVPTVLEAQAGGQEELVLPFVTVIASNPNAALIRVGKEFAEKIKTEGADQWQVKMRQS